MTGQPGLLGSDAGATGGEENAELGAGVHANHGKRPTDALVRVLRACICGSDLWPYGSKPAAEHGDRIGHEFLGVVGEVGSEVPGFKRGDVVRIDDSVLLRVQARLDLEEMRLSRRTAFE